MTMTATGFYLENNGTLSNVTMRIALLSCCVIIILVVLWALHNLFFHPLSGIPGPFFAKFTRLWLFSQDLTGNPHTAIRKLHQDLGPMVRISPNEVSIDDVDCNTTIYSQLNPWVKAPYHYTAFKSASASSIFTELDLDAHSAHLKLLSPSFSYAYVSARESKFNSHISKMIDRIRSLVADSQYVDLQKAFRSLALDVVTEYTFGKSERALDTFESDLFEIFDTAAKSVIFFQHFPLLRVLIPWIAPIVPALVPNKIISHISIAALNSMKKAADPEVCVLSNAMTIADKKGFQISDGQYISDGVVILAAGVDTTAAALSLTVYHLMRQPAMYLRLQQEIKEVMLTPQSHPCLTTLEKLPLLNAVFKEGLRVSCPIRGHLPRVVPTGGWNYRGVHFPAGTVVATSAFYGCYNEKVFPEPQKYDAERWLIEDTNLMNKFVQPFSRGTRQCIGQNLTLALQRLALAQFVRNFNVGSVETTDIKTTEYVTLLIDSIIRVKLEAVKL